MTTSEIFPLFAEKVGIMNQGCNTLHGVVFSMLWRWIVGIACFTADMFCINASRHKTGERRDTLCKERRSPWVWMDVRTPGRRRAVPSIPDNTRCSADNSCRGTRQTGLCFASWLTFFSLTSRM